jgi:hypothetical protein
VSQADSNEQEPLLEPAEPAETERWLAALAAAAHPVELDPSVNERLIELALEDPLAPASEEELIESARLRDALEQGGEHEDAATLAALRAAFDGDAEPPELERALQKALPQKPRSNVVFALFGAASAALAAAAVFVLFVSTQARDEAPALAAAPGAATELSRPRSTAPLFSERFETEGTTARMDLIASTRGRELRDNRYAAWGVR